MASKRKCKICGRSYDYCPTCYKDSFKPRWMINFDSEPCKKLWDILCSHGMGQITAKEALKQLQDIDYKSIMVENKEILAHITKIEEEAVKSEATETTESTEPAKAEKPVEAPKEEVAEPKTEPKTEAKVSVKESSPISVSVSEGNEVFMAINSAKEQMRKEHKKNK